jgi:hypothetical protein
MKVLIISEDHRTDRYILLPIIRAMMKAIGKPNAKVRMSENPPIRGVAQASDPERIQEIIDDHKGMVDLFLLIIDRDGDAGRRDSIDYLEQTAARLLDDNQRFLGENAWQEIEVWVLAGHNLPTDWVWSAIRQEVHPKETYFKPFSEGRGLQNERDGGRKILSEEAASRYSRIRQLCPEDVANLQNRISAWSPSE